MAADQELTAVWARRIRATDECIEGIQAMHEMRIQQELQRSIDGWWGRFAALTIQCIEDFVGADRLVAVPYELKNTAPLRGKAKSPLTTDLLGARHGLFDAACVIVLVRRKSYPGCCAHTVTARFRRQRLYRGLPA